LFPRFLLIWQGVFSTIIINASHFPLVFYNPSVAVSLLPSFFLFSRCKEWFYR